MEQSSKSTGYKGSQSRRGSNRYAGGSASRRQRGKAEAAWPYDMQITEVASLTKPNTPETLPGVVPNPRPYGRFDPARPRACDRLPRRRHLVR